MENLPNPFESPKVSWSSASDVNCSYDVVIVHQDLASKRVLLSIVLGVLLLIPMAAATIVALTVLERVFVNGQRATFRDGWAFMPFLVALWVVFRFAYRTVFGGAARARIRQNPGLLGRHSGTIDSEWFTSRSILGHSRQRVSACTFAARRGDVLEISFDQARASLAVLPSRCLSPENFIAAQKLFAAAARESAFYRGNIVDRRLLEGDFAPLESIENGIPFEGKLYTSDTGSLKKQVRKARVKVFFILVLWFIFAASLSVQVPRVWPITMITGVFVAAVLLRRFVRIGSLVSPNRIPLLSIKGTVGTDRLVIATPHAVATYWLNYLRFLDTEREVVSLAFPGSSGSQILLPKHVFQSEQAWESAVGILQSACQGLPLKD